MTSSPNTILTDWRRALNLLPTVLALGLVLYAIIVGGHFVSVAGFALIYAVFVTGLNMIVQAIRG